MKKLLLLICAAILISSVASADDQAKLRVVALGDSLTAGYGIGQDLAWPALLEEAFSKRITVLNAGVSGDTSAGGLRRANWVLKQKVDILILALGANDMLRGQPPEKTKENLKEIITLTKNKYPNSKILLAGIKALPSLGSEYVKSFEGIYKELAESKNVFYVPFLLKDVAGEKELNLKDRIHPNEKGHKIIAKTIASYLDEHIKK